MLSRVKSRAGLAQLVGGVALVLLLPVAAQAGSNDNLNATLWTQQSVEFKGNAIGAYALATLRLDQALADRNWTALPTQTAGYQDMPPAVILDIDETVLDNSAYQAWMVVNDQTFNPKTWGTFVNTASSTPIPGSLEFTKYAAGKGVKVFYVSNRVAEEKEATVKNLEKLGYPMGGNVDTVLVKGQQKDWGSAKSTRWAVVAKDYRVLLMMGDNFGDFTDSYKGTPEQRQAAMEETKAMWGKQWIVVANPTYGSWESAPFGHNYKLSGDEQREKKREALVTWKP